MEVFDKLHAFFWDDPTANNCNTYLLKGEKNILVDPGHDHLFGHVLDSLSALSLELRDIDMVFITHGHPDHIEAVRRFKDLSTLVIVPEAEIDFIKDMMAYYGLREGNMSFEPEILVREGHFKAGDMEFQVIHSPGHSPGSVCLRWIEMNVLFTGDVVFNQGVGRTDLPGGSGQTLKESIRRISQLPIDCLLPGHGEPVMGEKGVKENFRDIERIWFSYM